MKKDTVITLSTARWNLTAQPLEIRTAYEAIAGQAETQEDADETFAVGEKLAGLNDRDLYLAARDDQPVAKQIGESNLPESTLKALANFELEKRERERAETKLIVGQIVTGVIAFVGWSVALY